MSLKVTLRYVTTILAFLFKSWAAILPLEIPFPTSVSKRLSKLINKEAFFREISLSSVVVDQRSIEVARYPRNRKSNKNVASIKDRVDTFNSVHAIPITSRKSHRIKKSFKLVQLPYSHAIDFSSFASGWFCRMWIPSTSLYRYDLSQCGHGNTMPLWVSWCELRPWRLLNRFGHWLHAYGCSVECTSWCFVRATLQR